MRFVLVWLCLGALAWGQEVEPSPEPPPPELEVNGYWSTGYTVNQGHPDSGVNQLRGYDFFDRRLQLDVLELNFQYALGRKNETGFRLALTGGTAIPRIDAAGGLFRDPYTGQTDTKFDIRYAYLTHTFDNGLRLDAGKFNATFGYEVMDGLDGRNPNGTRALAFTFLPFTHTGLKLSYPLDDHWSVTGVAALGADQFQDTNRSLALGGQVNYHPTDSFSVAVNFLTGPERAYNDTDNQTLVDLVASYKVTDEVTLAAHAFRGAEAGLGRDGGTAAWDGFVFYWMNDLDEHFSLNLRQEFFNDPQGARLPRACRESSFTITPEYRITPDWIYRVDFRFERADRPVFDRRSRLSDYQNTVFLNQVVRF